MFRRAITRTTRTGPPAGASGKERLGRPSQPLLERDAGPVAEDLARRRDVGPRVADVAGARLDEAPLDGLPDDLADRLGDAVDTGGLTGRDVEDAAAGAG